MSKNYGVFWMCLLLLTALWGCGRQPSSTPPESEAAKKLLQGIWSDEETETLVFQIRGDSVYYPDTTSLPAYFRIYEDTLYIGTSARYHIEKQSEHVFWFKSADGELVKLVKDDATDDNKVFEQSRTKVLTLTEVLKKDTVVMFEGQRYHLYIAVNPTKYKVVRHAINDDGLDVENVYYDNIIHLSVFNGSRQLFSSDFRKQRYRQRVPPQIFEQAILNNMEFSGVDANGLHVNVSLCIPDDASCYLIEHVVNFQGQLSTQLLEY